MTIDNPTAAISSDISAAVGGHTTTAGPASKRWLTGAFLLAGAAQLITISALLAINRISIDRTTVTWAELLLAIAPAPVAALAAFTPAPLARPATIVAAAVVIVGIVGAILHTGLFFAPALVLLVVGSLKLWRERA
jgi:hypothetical protein